MGKGLIFLVCVHATRKTVVHKRPSLGKKTVYDSEILAFTAGER